ncbi:MAG: amidohydrolase [bacterium]|jgi:predicted amidohydrolase YtcJ
MTKADLVFVNANILTLDDAFPRATALAAGGGRLLAVGDDTAVRDFITSRTTVIDLAGKTVLPGFNDSHLHFLYPGTLMRVNVLGSGSIDELIGTVRETVAAVPPGTPLDGWGWDQNLFPDQRYPDRQVLDAAAPLHPLLLIHVGGHAAAANSRMLALAGITRDTPDPDGGHIDRDAAGEPTGVLRESATQIVMRYLYPPDGVFTVSDEGLKEALRRTMLKAVACGLTSATTDDARFVGGFERCFGAYRELWAEGAPMVRTYQLIYHPELEQLMAAGLRTGDGDERLRVGAIKIFQDGSFMAQTAALQEPYCDKPDSRGMLIHPQADFDAIVAKAHAAGMQVAVHVIGDAGIVSGLDAIARAQAAHPRPDARHRLVHYEVLTEDILRRTRELGVAVDIQPKFVTSQGHVVEGRVGPERARLTFPWQMVLQHGIAAAGSSDYPVEPFAPLPGIWAAVNRTTDRRPDETFLPGERLSVPEALRLFTSGGAYATFEENIKGTLTPGKLADIAVLSDDPTTVPPETIRDLRVEMTVINGRIVYQAG